MKVLNTVLHVIMLGLVVLFALQNLATVTISFFTFSATMPLALLVVLVYLLGMSTGGFLIAMLRRKRKRDV